jgi:alkylhydroperoxidase family enzyme
MDKEFLTPKELTILKFAIKAAKEAHRITDMEVNQLKQIGITDEDLVEIVATVALAAANYVIADSLDIPAPDYAEPLTLEEFLSD